MSQARVRNSDRDSPGKTAKKEAAWHRRQRTKRADARVLLRVAGAQTRLASHHSAQKAPMSPSPRRENRTSAAWRCKTCKGDDGLGFKNFDFRTHCFRCNLHKGVCFGANVEGRSPSTRPAREPSQARQRTDDKQALRIKKLEEELRKFKAADGQAASPKALADAPPGQPETPDFGKEISRLAKVADQTAAQLGEEDALTISARRRLKELQQRRDESKPLAARVRAAKARHAEAEKAVEASVAAIAEKNLQIKQLQEEVAKQEESLAEQRKRTTAEANEVRALLEQELKEAAPATTAAEGEGGESVFATFAKRVTPDMRKKPELAGDITKIEEAEAALQRLRRTEGFESAFGKAPGGGGSQDEMLAADFLANLDKELEGMEVDLAVDASAIGVAGENGSAAGSKDFFAKVRGRFRDAVESSIANKRVKTSAG